MSTGGQSESEEEHCGRRDLRRRTGLGASGAGSLRVLPGKGRLSDSRQESQTPSEKLLEPSSRFGESTTRGCPAGMPGNGSRVVETGNGERVSVR